MTTLQCTKCGENCQCKTAVNKLTIIEAIVLTLPDGGGASMSQSTLGFYCDDCMTVIKAAMTPAPM